MEDTRRNRAQRVSVLEGGAVLAEYGPMRLIISAYIGKVPQREMAVRAAEESFSYLERIARVRHLLSGRGAGAVDLVDPLVRKMIKSSAAMGDPDLTPMASVAGTIADEVADFLFCRGMTKVVVDNGGDVAVRLASGPPVRVGIRPDIRCHEISHIISLGPDRHRWGVATSGLGGRSLTRGVLTAATVVAEDASLADAAATYIANASLVKDDQVIQCPAEEIDPETDIPGIMVTTHVGPLSPEKKSLALDQALKSAEVLKKRGLILAAFVAIGGSYKVTDLPESVSIQPTAQRL